MADGLASLPGCLVGGNFQTSETSRFFCATLFVRYSILKVELDRFEIQLPIRYLHSQRNPLYIILPSCGVALDDRGQCDEADHEDGDVELAIHDQVLAMPSYK